MRAGARAAALAILALALSACGGSTTSPVFIPDGPLPTATPAPEVAAAAALAAFTELIAQDDLGYHLDQHASIVVDKVPLVDAKYRMDVSGMDFAGSIELLGQTVDIVVIDDAAWTRAGDATWTKGKAPDAGTRTDIVAPWRYLGPLDKLEFVEPGPGHSYRFANSAPIPYQTSGMKAQGYQGTIDDLTLEIAADGTPRLLTLHGSAKPKTGPLKGRAIDLATTIDFGQVGEPVEIEQPA